MIRLITEYALRSPVVAGKLSPVTIDGDVHEILALANGRR
jgi:hypothetical protein